MAEDGDADRSTVPVDREAMKEVMMEVLSSIPALKALLLSTGTSEEGDTMTGSSVDGGEMSTGRTARADGKH